MGTHTMPSKTPALPHGQREHRRSLWSTRRTASVDHGVQSRSQTTQPQSFWKAKATALANLLVAGRDSPASNLVNSDVVKLGSGEARCVFDGIWNNHVGAEEDNVAEETIRGRHRVSNRHGSTVTLSSIPVRVCRVPGCTSYNCVVQGRP